MKICSKKGCNEISQIKRSQEFYCFKCYRFKQMRYGAKKANKYIPEWQELERLLPQNMICPTCDKQMVWHSSLSCKGDVISIQHNHDKSIILICCSCNTGHGRSKLGDEYFKIDKNHQYCSNCQKILSINQFYKYNNICKKCHKEKNKKRFYDRKNKKICVECGDILSDSSIFLCEKHLIKHREYSKKKRLKNKLKK